MKAFVSILFSIALLWTQTAFMVDPAASPAHESLQKKCCKCEKMACCVSPVPTSIPRTMPAASSRSVSHETNIRVLSAEIARLSLPDPRPADGLSESQSSSAVVAPPSIQARLCIFLI